ncbi:MAG: hypothetical protein ACI8ZM_004559 [Crocinitomix sp.]|jgi:hypothetical protein
MFKRCKENVMVHHVKIDNLKISENRGASDDYELIDKHIFRIIVIISK